MTDVRDSAARVAAMGASAVVDYHEPDWPERMRVLAGSGADDPRQQVFQCDGPTGA